jgi:hypothetical protein
MVIVLKIAINKMTRFVSYKAGHFIGVLLVLFK